MSILEFLSQPTWQRLALTLGHFLWQGLAVALLIAAVTRLGRFPSGNRRYTAYLLAFIIMLACPIITFLTLDSPAKSEPAAVFPPSDANPIPHTPMVTLALPLEIAPIIAHELPANVAPETGPLPLPLGVRISNYFRASLPIAMAAWLLGVLALSIRLLLGLVGVQRWRRQLEPLPERLSLRVTTLAERLGLGAFDRVFISLSAAQAVAVGYLRPMVLLPAAVLTQMPPEMLEAVIAHELAHIRRFDLYVNLIQRIAETLLFYHPALWWLSNRLRGERELCCDELAIRATGQRLTYASTLERAARNQLAIPQPATALALGRDRRSTLTRVRHILGLTPTPQTSRPWLAGLITVLLLAIFAAPNAQSDDTDKALDRLKNAPGAFDKAIAKPDVLVETKNAEKAIWVVEDYGPTRLLSNSQRPDGDWVSIIASVVKNNGYYSVPDNGLSLKDLIRAAGYNKDKLAESYITVSREIQERGQRAFKLYSRNLETLFSGQESDILLEHGNAVLGGFIGTAPNAQQWWAQYSFSNVHELTVNDDNVKVNVFADLDTAKLMPPPTTLDITDENALLTWIEENGIDVMGETAAGVRGLVGFNVFATRVDNYFWDVDKLKITDRLTASMDEMILLSSDNDLPVTYLIKTSEHTMGVLQILGFAKNPGGVNIRYKLLQKQDVVSKPVPHNTDSTVQQIAVVLELWHEGCKTLNIEKVQQACAPSYSLAIRDVREMAKMLDQGGAPAWTFGLLAIAWENDDAIAVSQPILHSDPKRTPESVLLWTLKKENNRWGITDIDLEEAAGLQIENFRFFKQHPHAKTWFNDPDHSSVNFATAPVEDKGGVLLKANAHIQFISANEGGEKKHYRWGLTRNTPLKVVRGWFWFDEVGIREHGGGGRQIAETNPMTLTLDISHQEGFLLLDKAYLWSSEFGDQKAATTNKIEWPPNATLITYYLSEPTDLTDTLQPLWKGKLVQDDKVIKTIIYAVRVVRENAPDGLFATRDDSEAIQIARAWAPTPDGEIGP